MKADREFDARVAEEVMGWTRNQWKGMLEKTDYCILCGITCRVGSPPDPEFDFCTTNPSFVAPRYSTLIADAKQVLHKMIGNGYAVEITHDCVAWSVGFTHLDSGRPYFADWKDSLETQICIAALKAVEGNKQ